MQDRAARHPVRRGRRTGAALLALALTLALAGLSSCSSIFDAAVDSMIDRERDKAVVDAQADAQADAAQGAAAKSPAAQGAASTPQPAPRNFDPSVHRVVGVWENREYNTEGRSARVVFSLNSDGTLTYLAFDRLDGSGQTYKGTVTYIRTWIDEAGRSCGESTVMLDNGMSWNTLDRVSVDGNTLEVQSGVRAIDPKGPRYSIYRRP